MLQSPTINPFQTIQVFVGAIPVFFVFQSLQSIVFCFPFGDFGPFGLQAACLLGVRNSEIFWSDPLELGCFWLHLPKNCCNRGLMRWVQAQHLWVSSGLEDYHRGMVKLPKMNGAKTVMLLGETLMVLMQARWTKMGIDGDSIYKPS